MSTEELVKSVRLEVTEELERSRWIANGRVFFFFNFCSWLSLGTFPRKVVRQTFSGGGSVFRSLVLFLFPSLCRRTFQFVEKRSTSNVLECDQSKRIKVTMAVPPVKAQRWSEAGPHRKVRMS